MYYWCTWFQFLSVKKVDKDLKRQNISEIICYYNYHFNRSVRLTSDLLLISAEKTTSFSVNEFTSEFPVYSLDSPVLNTDASLLKTLISFGPGWALLDGRDWTSKLRPQFYNECLRADRRQTCDQTIFKVSEGKDNLFNKQK